MLGVLVEIGGSIDLPKIANYEVDISKKIYDDYDVGEIIGTEIV